MRYDDLPPFLRVGQVQELTQLGRSQVYELMRLYRRTGGRQGIPVVSFGHSLRAPTAALLRLGLVDPEDGFGGDHAA